jgi:hemerythrin
MEKYIWTKNQSVGVEEIDIQHHHFFDITNDLISKSEQENFSAWDLVLIVTYLNNYATIHLLTEENIFKRYNYFDAEEHIAKHDAYREKMKEFMARVELEELGSKKLALEIAEFAGNWLMNHIMVEDKKYVGFMIENGIK